MSMIIDDGFYNSTRWKKVRASVLRRYKYQCQICKRFGRETEATTVHHILHLEDHPELAFTRSNLISICQKCHNKEHPEKGTKSNMSKAGRGRY